MQSRIAFYAYSSHNIATSFTVQNAIEAINSSTREITVIDWATMDNSGKFIIPEICNQIDDADLFLCDLTDLNQNVLFELGYAVATRKRVWVTRQENKQWRDLFYLELGLLDTLGYIPYSNYRDIIDRFLQDMPHHDLDLNIYNQKIEPVKQRIKEPKLLFLKSPASTPSASSLNRLLMKSKFRDVLATDDPLETSVRSFEWYIENLLSSFAVISEFSSPPFDSKNAKYGFISGLAYGMNKLPLLIAQGPFDAPFDYKDSLYTYTDETERDAYVTEWLERKQTQYDKQLQTYKRYRRQQQRLEERQALRNINLGEYEAELERDQLVHYFVQTDSFNQALRNATYIIFSGRKGSGKTANFLRLAQHMRDAKSENNFVCVIKPLTYDISGVFQLYKSQLYNSVKMHVMETLWKFLIYTELARDLREHLDEKPEQLLSSEEKHLISFVDRTDYIKDDFTIRLDRMIQSYRSKLPSSPTSPTQQMEVLSEVLHNEIISQLRVILGGALYEMDRVNILIDNLDKPWSKNEDLSALSLFLFGLLNVVERISIEFSVGGKRKTVPVSLTVFIRADILSVIKKNVPEADKLRITSIKWDNEQRLLRLIEERFKSGLDEYEEIGEVWNKFFVRTVDGMNTRKFLFHYVLPRPRDIIYFCKQALFSANSNDHTRIEADDLKEAQKAYSNHTYLTLLEEIGSLVPDAPGILRQFMNAPDIITKDEIQQLIERAGAEISITDSVIDALCEATFLGYETTSGSFEFLYDDRKDDRKTQASRVIDATGVERYKINPPFHTYFEISSSV